MEQCFSIMQNHAVQCANFNYYQTALLHPDRVMKEHDFIYLVEGEWEIYQDKNRYLLKQDDVLVLHAGHHHFGMQKCAPTTKTMYIHAAPVNGDKMMESQMECTNDCDYLFLNTQVSCKRSYMVKKLFEDIIYTYWSEQKNKSAKMNALMNLLLCELSALSDGNACLSDQLVCQVLYRIKMTPQKIHTIDELAKHYHISPRSLVTRFKNATGKPIHQYQLDLKLDMACSQITSDTQKTFREIAFNFGFYDEFHFSRCFKKRFGIPPSQLRQRAINL